MNSILRAWAFVMILAGFAFAQDEREAAYLAAFDKGFTMFGDIRPGGEFHDRFMKVIEKEVKAGTLTLDTPERIDEIIMETVPLWTHERDWAEAVKEIKAKYPDLNDEVSHFSLLFDAEFQKRVNGLPDGGYIRPNQLMEMADGIMAAIREDSQKKEIEDAAFVAEFDKKWAEKQRIKALEEGHKVNVAAAELHQYVEAARLRQAHAQQQHEEAIERSRQLAQAQADSNAEAQRALREEQEKIAWQLEEQQREMIRIQREMHLQRLEEERRQAEEWRKQRQMEIDRINRRQP
jgi:hypothetical protein